MILYFSIALIGVIVLAASALFGEVFEFFDGLDSLDGGAHPLSGKVVATALVAFGATGMLTSYYDWEPFLGALTSALSAVFLGAVVWFAINALHNQTASTDFQISSVTGRNGEVIIGIPQGSVGEIQVATHSGTRQMIARSSTGDPIPPGTSVRVLEVRGSMVIVERSDQPVAPAAAHQVEG
jgi:membrane-bound ClpP family serine protease